MYGTSYRFGCEPYLLLSRRHAPPYPEDFVGYGKDRVAYTNPNPNPNPNPL